MQFYNVFRILQVFSQFISIHHNAGGSRVDYVIVRHGHVNTPPNPSFFAIKYNSIQQSEIYNSLLSRHSNLEKTFVSLKRIKTLCL